MRVGLLTYGMETQLTGIGRYAQELSYHIRQVDPSIAVFLINPYPDSALAWYRDFPVIPVPQLKKLPAVLTIGHHVIAGVAKRHRLDVVHDPCGIAPFLAVGNFKRVVTIHDAIPLIYPKLYPLLGNMVFRTTIPLSRWTTDAVITDSNSAKEDLVRFAKIPKEHISVIYPGVRQYTWQQIEEWRSKSEELKAQYNITEPYFLYVGAINPRKNVSRIIEATRIVNQNGIRVTLVMVGPDRPQVGNGDNIKYLGYVDEEWLHILYANARAVLMPSLYEGFGFPVVEAMAHGTRVISSNTSSLVEVGGTETVYVDPDDTVGWVGAIKSVSVDVESAMDRFRAKSHRFSWTQVATETADIYRMVRVATSV